MKLDRRAMIGGTFALTATTALAQGRKLTELPVTPAAAEDTRTLGVTQNLRYAVNIEMWRFGTDDPAQRIARAADLGFTAVEMWPWRGKDVEALARVSRERNVEIVQFTGWGFTPGLNDPANHDAFTAEITASCETALKLGTRMILVVAGNDRPGVTKEAMHQHVIDGLKRAVPIADKYGMTLILEPMNVRVDHKGHCLYGSPDAIRIVQAVDSPRVKLCWDLYHMQISEGDLCGRLREGMPHIAYLQLADNPGRRDPGTGEVNYQRVMREAHHLGYRGLVGLEFTPRDTEVEAARRVAAIDRF
jgi:hydroxypyruvate isomerase